MIKPSKYSQILRINPNTHVNKLARFKEAIRCVDNKGFDLNAFKEEPQELVQRTYEEVVSTSAAARQESQKLCEKYQTDNIVDWRKENWGVACNVDTAIWINDFTVYLSSEEILSPAIIKLAIFFNMEVYFSFVEDCDAFFEEDCGLLKFKDSAKYFELGTDKFEKFVFGSVLKYRTPLTLELWEDWEIPFKNPERYYQEHFIEANARERMEEAFEHSIHASVTNLMTNEELSPEVVWEKLSQIF